MNCSSCGHQLTFYIILYLVDQSYSLANPMMNMEQAHPQPTIFDGELKSYQLKVDFIVMYLFTMAVISFLTNSDVFKLFFREWIGLSTSMNRYLLHVHAGIQQKWPVVFLFSFWKHDMT